MSAEEQQSPLRAQHAICGPTQTVRGHSKLQIERFSSRGFNHELVLPDGISSPPNFAAACISGLHALLMISGYIVSERSHWPLFRARETSEQKKNVQSGIADL